MYFYFQNWASLLAQSLGNLFKAVMENFVQNLTVILVKGIDFGQCFISGYLGPHLAALFPGPYFYL